ITGTSPAHDTRLSSSNTAESAMKLCDTCTGSAFLKPVRLLCGNSNHPSSEGTFLISTHAHPVNRSVDRGLDRSCCAENDEPLVELGVRCLWVVCFGYCRVRGMVAPRSWNARRWVSVGWASVGTVLSVPAKWTWLRVRVPRWVSSPW